MKKEELFIETLSKMSMDETTLEAITSVFATIYETTTEEVISDAEKKVDALSDEPELGTEPEFDEIVGSDEDILPDGEENLAVLDDDAIEDIIEKAL
jgi:hypothetical protein